MSGEGGGGGGLKHLPFWDKAYIGFAVVQFHVYMYNKILFKLVNLLCYNPQRKQFQLTSFGYWCEMKIIWHLPNMLWFQSFSSLQMHEEFVRNTPWSCCCIQNLNHPSWWRKWADPYLLLLQIFCLHLWKKNWQSFTIRSIIIHIIIKLNIEYKWKKREEYISFIISCEYWRKGIDIFSIKYSFHINIFMFILLFNYCYMEVTVLT